MWIVTTFGFFSVVEKPWDRGTPLLTVRARTRNDLTRLLKKSGSNAAVIRDDVADYRFRSRVARDALARLMADEVRDIDYENFKDEVKARQGVKRSSIYMRVWLALLELQPLRGARPSFWTRDDPFLMDRPSRVRLSEYVTGPTE